LLTYVLQNKLMNTEPTREQVGSEIVVGGSHVSYSVSGGAVQTVLLVHRALPGNRNQDVASVSSLLGATLIGMRVGQRAPLLCEDGSVRSLVVVDSVPTLPETVEEALR
jgi:transcription elongation GreA/GreB family factor